MTIPPPLSGSSVDRMSDVVEQADAAVDEGVPPAEAIAKAARDNGLPVGHLPLVVRSFNTGRAVRQLGESDPWAKAAGYPSTTVDAVHAVLDADKPVTLKTSADDDYTLPPQTVVKKAHTTPSFVPSRWTKEAVAKNDETKPVAPAPRSGNVQTKVAHLMDRLRDVLLVTTPEVYSGIKAATVHAHAQPGTDALEFLEHANMRLAFKSAAAHDRRPDPTVTTEHPAVGLIGEIVSLRSAFVDTTPVRPLGYEKVAGLAGDAGWFRAKSQIGQLSLDPPPTDANSPIGLGSIGVVTETKEAADDPKSDSAPTALGGALKGWKDSTRDYYDKAMPTGPVAGEPTRGATSLGKGFNTTLTGGLSALANNRLLAPAFDVRVSDGPDYAADAMNKTRKDLSVIDDTAALQNIVGDRRLMNADPKVLIETYQNLSRLAPNVMKNPAIASDFLHRRVQTGPLSSFDLKTLLDMEKTYVGSREKMRAPDPDNDD